MNETGRVLSPVGYVKVQNGQVLRTIECGDGTNVDVDAEGRVLGIEVVGHTDFQQATFAALRSLQVTAPARKEPDRG